MWHVRLSQKGRTPFWFPGLLFAAGDQTLKAWCTDHVGILKRVPLLGQDFLVLSRVLNRGVMFDHFSWIPDGHVDPYTVYAPAFVLALAGMCAALRFNDAGRRERGAWFALFFCGASNLLDQVRFSHAIDTLQIYYGGGEYLPFNLADVGLLLATAFVSIAVIRELRRAS